jgi:hypothetical protein
MDDRNREEPNRSMDDDVTGKGSDDEFEDIDDADDEDMEDADEEIEEK